jgi:hypothetical protein
MQILLRLQTETSSYRCQSQFKTHDQKTLSSRMKKEASREDRDASAYCFEGDNNTDKIRENPRFSNCRSYSYRALKLYL